MRPVFGVRPTPCNGELTLGLPRLLDHLSLRIDHVDLVVNHVRDEDMRLVDSIGVVPLGSFFLRCIPRVDLRDATSRNID